MECLKKFFAYLFNEEEALPPEILKTADSLGLLYPTGVRPDLLLALTGKQAQVVLYDMMEFYNTLRSIPDCQEKLFLMNRMAEAVNLLSPPLVGRRRFLRQLAVEDARLTLKFDQENWASINRQIRVKTWITWSIWGAFIIIFTLVGILQPNSKST